MKPEGRSLRRLNNLRREAHRTARVVPLLYPLVFPWVGSALLVLFMIEPEIFDHSDHV